ncbi:MAG: redoxin domain-containing protein [Thermoplasmata archaeon]|jgi:hypothetical protein
MAKSSRSGTPVRCPACASLVRADRLRSHLGSVHPGLKETPAAQAALRKAGSAPQPPALRKSRSAGISGWTRGRIIGIVIVVVIAALAAYAVLRPPPVTGVADGAAAPDFSFTTVSGSASSLGAYLGHPLVLWFVATFCSSCGEGTQIFDQQYYSSYHNAGVTVLELESYNNDGTGEGPSVSAFASAYGYTGQPGWVLGTASAHGTSLYNPQSDLDVYYVINAQGHVVLSGTGLGSNFGGALQAATQ